MTSCQPNTPPAYCLDLHNDECRPYPIQVTRQLPIADDGDNLLQQLNAAVQELIRQDGRADSVWQFYQLVGVLWSDSPVDENYPGSQPALTDLSVSGMRPNPDARPVANTMLETYIQGTTCIECHRGAALAWPNQDGTTFASDYSFVFQSAGPPQPGKDGT